MSFSLERLVFFSDAVFAIAITLLAIEIRLPEGAGDGDLNAAIADLAPMVFSYFLSFSVIGLSWLAHWRRYDLIERADERLAMINLAQLAFIALIPFPTALLGHYGDQAGPVILYAVIVACAGLLGTLTWIYADRNGMMRPGTTRETVRLATIRGLLLPLVFLSSLPLLLLHPYAVEAAWVLFFPLQALVDPATAGGAPCRRAGRNGRGDLTCTCVACERHRRQDAWLTALPAGRVKRRSWPSDGADRRLTLAT